MKSLSDQFGPPALLANYVVMSDAIAAVKLSQYLEQRGEHLWITGAPGLGLDSFGDRNVILLGIPSTSQHLRETLQGTNFDVPIGTNGTVVSRNPKPGEPDRFAEIVESKRRRNVPGLIISLAGSGPGTRRLLLVGRETLPLVTLLTSPSGLELLERIRSQHGSPEFFEAVIRSEMDGDTVINAAPVAFRSVPASH